MPGQALSDVVKLNQKTFTISGFGWAYGGHVVSWEGGKLDNKNVTCTFNDSEKNNLNATEWAGIQGDTEYNVSLVAIKNLNPKLETLIVFGKK